jgi:hypothetical protein
MTDFEVRKVTRTVGETDGSGQTTRDDTVYEVGTTIEDTFVRFRTITEEELYAAKQRAESGYYDRSESQPSQSKSRRSSRTSGGSAPDENVPASEASTATDAA